MAPPEVLAAVRAPFVAFGGVWEEPPVLQPLPVLLNLLGEAMRARLMVVTAGEGSEELALRPDFTIALARAHIASGAAAARRLYAGEAFRAQPAGSGPPAEFTQVGVETFGGDDDGAVLDGEVAALAWRAARTGGRDDLTLVMGDVALFGAFLAAVGAPEAVRVRLERAFAAGRPVQPELERLCAPAPVEAENGRLRRLLTGLPDAEAAAALEELWALAGIRPVGGRGAGEIVHRLAERAQAARAPRLEPAAADLVRRYLLVSAAPAAALEQVRTLAGEGARALDPACEAWARRVSALEAGGVPAGAVTLAAGFVRPFGYYDGALFEVRAAGLPADAPVAAGGRSDGLLARLGGASAPSVGCMVRPARAWPGAGR